MSPSRWTCISFVTLGFGFFGAGCEKQKPSNDKGKVNVHVNTPGGDYGAHVEYPKHRDSDQETKVKIEHK